jgi:aspartyl protease family protein
LTRLLIAIIVALLIFVVIGLIGSTELGLSDGDAESLVRYGLLAALVGSGIFVARRNLGQAARSLAIWALILLGLVTAYLYRTEAQDFASRISAGLVPGRSATFTDENGFNTVILYKARNGHYHADVGVGNRQVSMMVDTGASSIALSFEDAESLGLDPARLDFNATVMTANGPARTAYVTLPDVSIGAIRRTNVRAAIAERGKLGQSLLGMNFLETLSSFAFTGDELKLRD